MTISLPRPRPRPAPLPTRVASAAGNPLDLVRNRAIGDIERYDGSKLLCVYLALLIIIPSNLVVPGLGAAGSPAMLFGLVLFARWFIAWLQGAIPRGRLLPHWALLLFGMATLASFIAAQVRPLQTLEINGADRGLIRLVGWAGVMLTALDGLPNRAAFRRVLCAAGAGAAFLAGLGLLQAMTGFDATIYLHIPGLRANNSDFQLPPELRNGIPRLHATASHPIEYSTVLVLLVALVAPLALPSKPTRSSRWWFVAMLAVGLAFPQAVARSGFLAAFVLAIVVIPGLPARARRRVLLALPFGLVAVHFLFPSLLGTIRDMFTYTASGDETARTSDYAVSIDYFKQAPWFGRGFGTMVNTLYRTLDNQFLGTLLEAGLFGLLAFVFLHIASVISAARGRRLAMSADDKLLGSVLAGAPLAALVSSGTFDSLSFPMFAGLLFMILGLCGAFMRIIQSETAARLGDVATDDLAQPRHAYRNLRLRWTIFTAFMMFGLVAIMQIHSLPPRWFSATAVQVSAGAQPALQGGVGTTKISQILTDLITSDDMHEQFRAEGYSAEYSLAQGQGSLEPGTDVLGDGPILQIQADSNDPAEAKRTAIKVMSTLNSTLARMQKQAGVEATVQVVLSDKKNTFTPLPVNVGGKRAYAAVLLLVLGLSFTVWTLLEWVLSQRFRRILARERVARPIPRHRYGPALRD